MNSPTEIPQIIIRHLNGRKKGQLETFSQSDTPVIKFGRDPGNQVTFDAVAEDMVSRFHCIIQSSPDQKDDYQLVDNQSRNGTFLNNKKIIGTASLICGDIIGLGKDGPSFEFDLNPRPIQQTRVIDTEVFSAPATKLQTSTSYPTYTADVPKESIGKETLTRMLDENEKKSTKGLLITILAVLILLGTGAWIFFSRPVSQTRIVQINKESGSNSAGLLTPAKISANNTKKVVYIEMAWKLIGETGREVYHLYEYDPATSTRRPKYLKHDSIIEPYLVFDKYDRNSLLVPISESITGSGFVVDEQGFIITNRHIAAPWESNYNFPQNAFPGVLYESDKNGIERNIGVVNESDVKDWIPKEAFSLNRKLKTPKFITGEVVFMDVTFANNTLRTPAKLVRSSNNHDVSMIKIDLPESLTKVQTFDVKDQATGLPITVLGYPTLAGDKYVTTVSRDRFNRNPNREKVPVPSLLTGYVSRVVQGSKSQQKNQIIDEGTGDYYELSISTPGQGNSGGPVFDDQGRAIGIFTTKDQLYSAIPIKYALELFGTKDILK